MIDTIESLRAERDAATALVEETQRQLKEALAQRDEARLERDGFEDGLKISNNACERRGEKLDAAERTAESLRGQAAALHAHILKDVPCGRISNDNLRCMVARGHAGHHSTWGDGPTVVWPETEAVGWTPLPSILANTAQAAAAHDEAVRAKALADAATALERMGCLRSEDHGMRTAVAELRALATSEPAKPAEPAAERHWLIYGSISEPIGCTWGDDGKADALTEEPGARFVEQDPKTCPICVAVLDRELRHHLGHDRPDGQRCAYLADVVCNKCGWVAEPAPQTACKTCGMADCSLGPDCAVAP